MFKKRKKKLVTAAYWKKIEIEFSIVVLATVLTISLLLLCFWFFTPIIFSDGISVIVYTRYEAQYQNDPLVIQLANNCSRYSMDYYKVLCVNEYFKKNFVHIDRNGHDMLSPKAALNEGGLCRDAVAIYCTIFKRMGLECKYIFKYKHHVLNAVWINDTDYRLCLVDQESMNCWV